MITRPRPYFFFQKMYHHVTSRKNREPSKYQNFAFHLYARDKNRFKATFGTFVIAAAALSIFCTARPAAAERPDPSLGRFEAQSANQGMVVAAPHGTYDIRTDILAKNVARMLGAGYVIALGFSPTVSRVNVNRPTEGAGRVCERERHTQRAREVYDHYVGLIEKSSGGKPLRLYVELHGHTSLPFSNRLEIATVGISWEEARRVKERFPAFLAQAKAAYPAYPELDLRMEPVDKVFFGAGCNKKIGYLSTGRMARALHMEIPRSARVPEALEATAVLVNAIARAVMNNSDPPLNPDQGTASEAGKLPLGSPAR